jgi:[FeFe] hydrogenase H-cluster maturation GTPase HydF
MEILPIGPVVLIDTAGFDDEGTLGELRIEKTLEVIKKTDIALLVVDSKGFSYFDVNIINKLKETNTPFIVVLNKSDLNDSNCIFLEELKAEDYIFTQVSAKEKIKIEELKNLIIKHSPKSFEQPSILGELINPGDHVVLVTPIDTGMPKGRLILPQVQMIRDILDNDAIVHQCKEKELRYLLDSLKIKPKLVITDSQVFSSVSADTPEDIALTSFSILFAKYKGDLFKLVEGAKALKNLKAGDKVLIAEACTHHAQPDDIGTVKIPRWIKSHINSDIIFEFTSGRDYPDNLHEYKLVIHCGACTLNRKEMLNRIESSLKKGTPIINYGLCIAYLHGIFERALKPFPEVYYEWIDG